MNIRRIIRKITRRTPNPKTLFLPGAIVLLTIGLTFTIMTLISTPRAPRLKSGTGESLYTAANKTFSVGIGSKSGSPQISFSRGESGVQFALAGSAKVKPVRSSGTSVTFPSVNPGVDLVYTTEPDGLKEELILHNKPKDNTFLFDLTLSNATGKKITNDLLGSTFYDKDNQYLFHFEKPFAIDAKGVRTDDVLLQIGEDKQLPGKYYLKLIVDEEWLNSPTRAYPISVDPTIVHDTTAEFAAGTLNRVLDTGSGSSPRLESYYQPLVADEYTVGLWHMDEASDNTCSGGQDNCDSSGNSLHASVTGGSSIVNGKLSNARGLNGTNQFLSVPDSNLLSFGNNTMTMEAWVKRNGLPAVGEYFILKGITTWEYAAFVSTTGQVAAYLFTSAGATVATVTSNTVITDNNWHHVAITSNGLMISIYIDGVLDNNSNTFSSSMTNTAATLYFGDRSDVANTEFEGSVDEIRLSNTARSSEEIKANALRRPYSVYTSEVLDLSGAGTFVSAWNDLTWTELGVTTGDGETLKDSTSLLSQWNFNETSGTALDSSAGSCGATCDGTLTGFASTSSQDQAAGTGWTSTNKRWGAGALMLDGVSDTVSLGTESNYDFERTNSFSIETWIKTSTTTQGAIISKLDSAGVNSGFEINMLPTGRLRFNLINTSGGTNQITITTNSSFNDGKWHHVAVTYSGSSNATGAKIYVDGNMQSITIDYNSLSASILNNISLFVGSRNSTLYFNGIVDSTRLYTRELIAAEILSNYQAGQIELQTRVGSDTSPNDGSWEEWRPITGETLIEGFENNEDDTRAYEMGFSAPAVNPTWAKKNNTAAANSDTTSTDGRLGLGTNGTGDDTHTLSSFVIKDGSTYKMWYMGSDSTNWRIYYATSSDGLTWTKYNNAIPSNSDTTSTDGRIPLGTSGTGDDDQVGYPTVIKDGSTYKMWYSASDGTNWRIYHATSSDGLTWTKYNNAIEAASNTTGTQGRIPLGSSGGDTASTFLSTVIKDGSTYKMWYTAYDATNYRIYYATSSDGLTWTKVDNSVPSASDSTSTNGRLPLGTSGTADDVHTYGPSVIKDGSIYKMWYNMHDGTNAQIGYATSLDGTNWRKYHNAIPTSSNTTTTNGRIARGASGGDTSYAIASNVIKDNGLYKSWYTGYDGSTYRIYHASITPVPLSQTTESVIKRESSYSEKLVTAPLVDGSTVGLWHLDETSGTGAYIKDVSGNANHGTPTGTTLIEGVQSKARSFDGTNDYIDLGTGTSFDFGNNGPFTHHGWINIATAKDYSGFVSKVVAGRGGTYSYMTVVMANGSMSAYTGAAWVTPCAAGSVSISKWQHIAFVYDGTNITGYVNGASCGSVAFTYTDNTAHNVYIGSWYSPTTLYDFNGQIDEVVTSKVARSGEEIAEAYRLGRDHYINKTISSTDLSGKTTLPFYVAADRPGTYLQATVGESAYTNYQPDSSTGGLWHLDESIAPVKDAAGKTNGSVVGTTSVQGILGKSRTFNGTSDYLTIADNPPLNPSSQITTEAWVRTTSSASNMAILGKTTGCASSGYLMWLNNNAIGAGLPGFFIGAGAWVNGTIPVNDGKWHHIAGTFDGTTAKLYIDGVLNASGARSGTLTSSTLLQIGGQTTGAGCSGSFWFSGSIDEVRISSTARSADEIRQVFEMGSRTHNITIDFAAALDSGNLIADVNDLSFTVDATVYGLAAKGSMLFAGDKIIVKENYNGTEYFAQGTITAVTSSTGAVTIASWDSGSTFPSGGYTAGAVVFKWQREYWNVDGEVLDTSLDAITQLTLRLTDGAEGRTIYLDDLRSSGGYLTDPAGSTITSSVGNRYGQYRAILSSFNEAVSATLSAVTVDYEINVAPNTPTLDSPTDTAAGQSLTPTLLTTATDTNSDYLRYKIELCTNVGMTTGCQTFDQTSSQTGWSGQNAQTSTAYTSGTQASYALQTPLSHTTTYYWRSYAIDPAGTNTWGATQGTPYSFTTHAAPTSPTTPWTEGLVNPTGITDLTPEFSAIYGDPDGDPAVFYEIEVNTNNTFSGTVMWDSGSTAMASLADGVRSTDVAYAGTTPSWATTYYWRIRFTDDLGGVGAWSATQSFNMNTAPATPTLSTPTDTATGVSLYPALQTVTTDTNSDYLRYKIELCTNVGMTTGCQTFDQTSSQTGWSGQNAQTSTAYTSGTTATYTLTSPLPQNTTYYWRSYAIDPAGTDTWSSTQGAPYSFTTKILLPEATECRINESNDKTSFVISWFDRATVEDGYEIQKSVNGGAWSVLATGLAANTTSHTDSPITAGSQYSYRVAPYITSVDSDTKWCTTSTLLPNTSTFKIN